MAKFEWPNKRKIYTDWLMDPIELEESSGLIPVTVPRPRMDEPPPVRLIAVDDVRLLSLPGTEKSLDRFYVDLLEFDRDSVADGIVYRAENFRLRFTIVNQMPLERDGIRPIGIDVRSLADAERKLFDYKIEYLRQRGLLPGLISLLVQDPAGNWIELFEAVQV
jgi:hypothetical protein